MSDPRPPDLRLARRRLLALLDGLPASGPAWHPTWRVAVALRAQLLPLLAELTALLEPSPPSPNGSQVANLGPGSTGAPR